ncbi:tetrapyrrole-binding protein, chloroplastic [Magnolia sinica]|uniref:tetrapyrrole-binding protein, chloroplastic n=1 Tax=Magnolia sinica TaxID=86752 RepID=UPI002657BC36|nr:tetrapyrrole-binding protein, chloroplastic [Magnolia sinica]
MATTSIQSLHHPLHRHNHSTLPPPDSLSSSLFLKPPTPHTPSLPLLSLSLSSPFSLSSSSLTTNPSSTASISFDLLQHHLSSQNFRLADEETRRLLISLAGDPAVKRGYVFFSEVQFISEADLKTIDALWRQCSGDKFGYSVQKRIWEKKAQRDFTKFFFKVGWMKKLDTEVEQFNYRSFPDEFIWELKDDTPEGHLPLTNALRGTQLLSSILTHPAFEGDEEEVTVVMEGGDGSEEEPRQSTAKPLSQRSLKPDYSF